jgi:hypothetical protein
MNENAMSKADLQPRFMKINLLKVNESKKIDEQNETPELLLKNLKENLSEKNVKAVYKYLKTGTPEWACKFLEINGIGFIAEKLKDSNLMNRFLIILTKVKQKKKPSSKIT